jgi:hypothetical protein
MIISLLSKRIRNLLLINMVIIALIVQYNGKNRKYCGGKWSSYTYGRVAEVFPLSISGFFISSSGILNYFKKFRWQTIIAFIYLFNFFLHYQIFVFIRGYMYQGVKLFFLSNCIFIVFAMFPSEKIKNKIIIRIIKQLTNYTGGIYYLHSNLHKYFNKYNVYTQKKTIKGCVIVYLICYLICFIGHIFLGKTKLRYLFE